MEILKEIIAADKAAAARVEALRAQQENSLAERGRAADIANEKQTAEARSELDKFIAEQTRALTEKQQNSTGEAEAASQRVKDIFDAHRGEWIFEIMQNITGV